MGILELTPFIYSEIAGRRAMKLENLWLRGGYPDALLARDPASWHAWQESYLRTFIERDIARHPLNISSIEVRRLLTMLAHSHGGLVNHSTLGRSLGYSYHTIQSMLDLFAGYFLIRRLQPFHANVRKRLVKASKVYLRDSADRLKEYLAAFDPSFVGGTGTALQMAAVRRSYGVTAEKHGTGKDYAVAHSSFVYLITREGKLRALMPFGHKADDYVHDISMLLN